MSITDSFRAFCTNIKISTPKRSTIAKRYESITQRLNNDFWQIDSRTANSRYAGSYGRGTAIEGFSDLDMIFELPYNDYVRFTNYSGNGQSALLQAVRNSIRKTYSSTRIGADGQVVVVPFLDRITFEVVPAFINNDGSYTFPNAKAGGSWKTTNPIPEIQAIGSLDAKYNGNLKNLCRMMRAWKNKWNVPMGGLLIDTLAHNFLSTWEYRDKSFYYYDFLSRDFFKYLAEQNKKQTYWYALGSNQKIYRKGLFEAKAKKCYAISLLAINAESKGYIRSAKIKWRQIYGPDFAI